MKTKNLELELMTVGQENKEIFINETIGVIDSFSPQSVTNFITHIPADSQKNQKFIMADGEYKNHICYATFPSKAWRYLPPKFGMIFYCIEKKAFVFFDGTNWITYETEQETVSSAFEGSSAEYEATKKHNFIYMESDALFKLKSSRNPVINLIIKQNASRVFKAAFDSTILWQGTPYIITQTPNQMDHIRLTKIPETEHFLGEVVFKGYKY